MEGLRSSKKMHVKRFVQKEKNYLGSLSLNDLDLGIYRAPRAGDNKFELVSRALIAADIWLRIIKVRGVPVVRVPQRDQFFRGSF